MLLIVFSPFGAYATDAGRFYRLQQYQILSHITPFTRYDRHSLKRKGYNGEAVNLGHHDQHRLRFGLRPKICIFVTVCAGSHPAPYWLCGLYHTPCHAFSLSSPPSSAHRERPHRQKDTGYMNDAKLSLVAHTPSWWPPGLDERNVYIGSWS